MGKVWAEKSMHRKGDSFIPILTHIFTIAQWFGIPTYGNRLSLVWAVFVLCLLAAIEIAAIWRLARVSAGLVANDGDDRGFAARLSGSIFYANGLLSQIFCWRFIIKWKILSFFWAKAEISNINLPPDPSVQKKIIFVTLFVSILAAVEHMLSMISATGFDCPPTEYFQRYILSSHGFILSPENYSLWVAIPIFISSKIATILWNFQDLIIILISMGLTSRYHRLNLYVNRIVTIERRNKHAKKFGIEKYMRNQHWRWIREAYVRQAALVRMVDSDLGALVLLSNINNFYFICLQLFLGLNQSQGSLHNYFYYFLSLGWLLFRACSVVLAAADVHIHSKRALSYLSSCPDISYNIEIKRLYQQLTHDFVALGGMGFFYLGRSTLLEVAANIIKYELVLIQYDK